VSAKERLQGSERVEARWNVENELPGAHVAENIQVPGARIVFNGGELTAAARAQAIKNLWTGGAYLQRAVQQNISVSFRDGGPQLRYHPKRAGTASIEGEYPRADTGKLRQSIFFLVNQEELYVIVGSPLEYAAYLEFSLDDDDGGSDKRIRNRSYLRRTLYEEQVKIREILLRGFV
jgi:hypothetical protein